MQHSQNRHHGKHGKNKKGASQSESTDTETSEIEMDMKADEMPPLNSEAQTELLDQQHTYDFKESSELVDANAPSITSSSEYAEPQLTGRFQAVKGYAKERPLEAVLVAIFAGVAGWALLNKVTKKSWAL